MNRLRATGTRTFGAPFGEVCAVYPAAHVSGNGHGEHIYVHFVDGITLELSPETAIQLARRLPEAIAALPVHIDCSGAVADLEET